MDDNKIIFYSLGSQRLDFSKFNNIKNYDNNGPIKVSSNFNKALSKVIDKDINSLNNKIKEMIKGIEKYLAIRGVIIKFNETSLDKIDSIINFTEAKISELIIEKGNNKIGVFTSKKNEKRQRNLKLDECIDYLSKCMTDLISMKNEYNKLTKTKPKVVDTEENENTNKEDPLERTISFYMNKEKV